MERAENVTFAFKFTMEDDFKTWAEASIVAQCDEATTLASHMSISQQLHLWASSMLMCLERQWKMALVSAPLQLTWETQSSQLLLSVWSSSACCEYLGREPAEKRSLPLKKNQYINKEKKRLEHEQHRNEVSQITTNCRNYFPWGKGIWLCHHCVLNADTGWPQDEWMQNSTSWQIIHL